MEAIEAEHKDIVEIFLQHGCDLNLQENVSKFL